MYKDLATQLDEKIARLVDQLDTGVEMRAVECEERPDYARGVVDLVRADTGAVWTSRPMAAHERQAVLDLEHDNSVDALMRRARKPDSDEGVH